MEAQALPRSGRLFLPRSRKALRALGDERLVEQVRRGNDDAFEVIYDRHHRGILAFCRHMLASADEAEDALQQTFISAYRGMGPDGREIRLKPWLYGIARNHCFSTARSRHQEPGELDELATAGLSEQVQQRADLRELLHDLHALPVDQRAALVLTEVGGLSHADVGSVLGCEVAKVKSLVFQARSSLIETRKARAIPCHEIREQLATATGGALRRSPLRRHLRACAGCAEFRDDVMRQRKALAAILPVVPSVGLKSSLLASIGFGSGGGGAAIGGGAAGSGIATVASSGAATKFATLVALGGLALGGEVVIDGKAPSHTAEAKAGQHGSRQASPAPSAVTGPGAASHRGAARHLRTRPASGAPGSSPNVTAPGRGHATSGHGAKGRPVRTHAPQSPGLAPGATPPASAPSGTTTTTSPAPASTPAGNGNGNGNGNAGNNGQHRGWTSGRGNPHAHGSTGMRVPPGHQGDPTPAPAGPPTSAPGRSESAPGQTGTAGNNGNANGNGNGNAGANGNAGGNGNGRALGHQ
jgi:RNA polymerase sigma factor (sigma-70 family)